MSHVTHVRGWGTFHESCDCHVRGWGTFHESRDCLSDAPSSLTGGTEPLQSRDPVTQQSGPHVGGSKLQCPSYGRRKKRAGLTRGREEGG